MSAALKFVITQVVPRIPFLYRLAIAHCLGLLETSSKWDLRTTLIVRFIRALIGSGKPTTVSKIQKGSLRDPGISGPLWVSSVTIPQLAGDDNVRSTLLRAVDARKAPGAIYDIPTIQNIYAEWTGYRQVANKKTPYPKELTEAARYHKLMVDTKSDSTVLYFHGGALYLMDVATHRTVCSTLSKISGGRCFSVRYRLAPKFSFPSALLDCLTAYLYLLHPPPGSFHEPVEASKIVLAGDSAGGNLCFALLQLLLEIHRSVPTGELPQARFFGKNVDIPLPGGVACASAWVDLTSSMPSILKNHKFDYLPLASGKSMTEMFLPCDIWPATPRREDLYCDVTMLIHPFASPLATKPEDWSGAPPVFLFYGQEMLCDEGKYLAGKLVKAGVSVQWAEFEAMPHCFSQILAGTEVGKLGMSLWGNFIAKVTEGQRIETRGHYYQAKKLTMSEVDIATLGDLSEKEVLEKMQHGIRIREGYAASAEEKSINFKSKL